MQKFKDKQVSFNFLEISPVTFGNYELFEIVYPDSQIKFPDNFLGNFPKSAVFSWCCMEVNPIS